MNDKLVSVNHGQLVTDSRKVAAHFNKRHDHVIRDIDTLVGGLPKNGDTQHMFYKTTYINAQNGQTYPMYLMTRNGVDYFLSGKYQPKDDPKPKALISLHGPGDSILRVLGEALYRIATDTKNSPVSRLIFIASLREMLDDAQHALDDQIIESHRKGDARHEN